MATWYAALVGVGAWHFTGGWAWWLGWKGVSGSEKLGKNRDDINQGKRRRWIINGLSALGMVVWLAGGLGIIGRGGSGSGWEGKNWDMIYSRVPLLGRVLLIPEL
jgi:hypothetical protein